MMNLQGNPILSRGVGMFNRVFLNCFFTKIGEFLCSLEWKFPEFYKTHPTFVFGPLLMPPTARQILIPLFLGHPVHQSIPFHISSFYQKNVPR